MSYSVQQAVSAFASHALGEEFARDCELESMPVADLGELISDLESFIRLVREQQKAFQRSPRST